MKNICLIIILALLITDLSMAQPVSTNQANDQTQEERNLEILSKKLVRMKKEMDKFVKDMSAAYQGPDSEFAGPFGVDVRVDIADNGDHFTVTADLPGMDKDKIDVILESGRTLKISGTRHIEKRETAPGAVRQERMEGKFERVLELPAECKSEGISASYANGVLTIMIPKKEPKAAEAIKVKVL